MAILVAIRLIPPVRWYRCKPPRQFPLLLTPFHLETLLIQTVVEPTRQWNFPTPVLLWLPLLAFPILRGVIVKRLVN